MTTTTKFGQKKHWKPSHRCTVNKNQGVYKNKKKGWTSMKKQDVSNHWHVFRTNICLHVVFINSRSSLNVFKKSSVITMRSRWCTGITAFSHLNFKQFKFLFFVVVFLMKRNWKRELTFLLKLKFFFLYYFYFIYLH